MKFKSLLLALCFLAVLALTATPAFAVGVIDVNYYWYSTGGTKAVSFDASAEFIDGDISGTALAKIEELYDSSTGEFRYTLSNLRSDRATYAITKWELNNPYAVVATSVTSGPASTSWSVTTSLDKWTWATTVFGEGADGAGDVDNFRVFTPNPRGIVTGKVYFFDSSGTAPASNPTASGKVSGPVPEPSSLLLLGSGLLGLGLLGAARKRRV